jgi:chromosome partitioning protein
VAARITAVVNQKGGVGKTTTAYNVAVALHRLGRRVLLVDLDPQASLTLAAGIALREVTSSVYELLLRDDVRPEDVAISTSTGVDLIPSHLQLAAAELELAGALSRERILKEKLQLVADRYDHILIDCGPSLGLLTVNALTAAHRVLTPCQTDYLAVGGLALLDQTIGRVRSRLNQTLGVPMVLPTMFDGRLAHDREMLGLLEERYAATLVGAVVRRTTRLKEAPAGGVSILDYDPKNPAAQAFKTVAEVLDRE